MPRTLLREKPTIVHFSGHGASEGIFLVTENLIPQLAPTDALKKLFSTLAAILKIECVVLNSCFSENQANELIENIPFVIGAKSAIGDKHAINFSVGFYQGITGGADYEAAFELGRVLVMAGNGDENILVFQKKQS